MKLQKALLSDAMFLYAPSQISLATIKYGLQKIFGIINLIFYSGKIKVIICIFTNKTVPKPQK